MHFSFKFIVLFFSSTVFEYGLCQLFEGDPCSLSSGANGICKLISLCPSALTALTTRKIYPTKCGFHINEMIVCCATGSMGPGGTTAAAPPIITTSTLQTTTTKTIQTSPSATTQKAYLKVGDKSKEWCKKYEKLVFQPSGVLGVIGRPPPPDTSNCPIVVVENIVGGEAAKLKEFPHMALIGFEDGNNEIHYLCGGSLISDTFVLSAAHCKFLSGYEKPKYILLGELDLNSTSDGAEPQKIQIEEIIVHPKYASNSRYHDIALFKLKYKAELNTFTRPACLNTNPNLTNKLGVASGWGQTSYGTGPMSNKLLKVTLNMFTYANCKESYTRKDDKLANGIDEKTQLCAGSRTEAKDTCQGDSGGPLQIRNSELHCAYNIIGITSFGKGCGKIPGIYTRVSSYIGWIEDTVWP